MTLGALYKSCLRGLEGSCADNARFEARQIISHVCGISLTELVTSPEKDVSDDLCERCERMVSRRAAGEPLQYLLGIWEFYGLPFAVGEGVLIPRQDTETIAELALEFIGGKSGLTAADLCAGSGCIGITLAKKAGASVYCYELSRQAAEYLVKNIGLNGAERLVKPVLADVLSEETVNAAPEFDLILTNPPYLSSEDMLRLQTEVSYEPRAALYGGYDGMDFYRGIFPLWTGKLKHGGLIAAEIGFGQQRGVCDIMKNTGLSPLAKADLNGVPRVVYAIKS